ncbi:MAG: phage holin family protein [Myxococcales bacterium]
MRLLLRWILSAVALLIVAWLVPGFTIRSFGSALVAVLVIGLVNATIGLILKVLTLPLTVVTLGLFWWILNAFLIWFASSFVPGFTISGFGSAFVGAIVLALVNLLLGGLVPKREAGLDRSGRGS